MTNFKKKIQKVILKKDSARNCAHEKIIFLKDNININICKEIKIVNKF